MTPEEIAVGIVAMSGGKLVGRTRLQKTAFLLDQAGMNSGLTYVYKYYGPYSNEFAQAWDDASATGRLKQHESLGRYGVPYTIFRTEATPPRRLGSLGLVSSRNLIAEMGKVSDVVLELAATIVYLRQNGYGDGAIDEVKIRKPVKATDERLEKALALLRRLGLDS